MIDGPAGAAEMAHCMCTKKQSCRRQLVAGHWFTGWCAGWFAKMFADRNLVNCDFFRERTHQDSKTRPRQWVENRPLAVQSLHNPTRRITRSERHCEPTAFWWQLTSTERNTLEQFRTRSATATLPCLRKRTRENTKCYGRIGGASSPMR